MTDPVNVVIDDIPLTDGTSFIEYFNDTLYCTGGPTRRVYLRNKEIKVVTPGINTLAIALLDFHRPFDVPPDVLGSGTLDGRVYVSTAGEFHVAEIVPPLLDQFTQFKVTPQFDPSTFIACMVVAHSGKYLYFHDWTAITLGIVDLTAGPRTLFPTRHHVVVHGHQPG